MGRGRGRQGRAGGGQGKQGRQVQGCSSPSGSSLQGLLWGQVLPERRVRSKGGGGGVREKNSPLRVKAVVEQLSSVSETLGLILGEGDFSQGRNNRLVELSTDFHNFHHIGDRVWKHPMLCREITENPGLKLKNTRQG